MQPASQRRRDLESIAEIHQMHDDRFSEASRWALLNQCSVSKYIRHIPTLVKSP
jgi:hypothetical protein